MLIIVCPYCHTDLPVSKNIHSVCLIRENSNLNAGTKRSYVGDHCFLKSLFRYILVVLYLVLFTVQRPFLFSLIILTVETEYYAGEKFSRSQHPKDYFLTLLKIAPHGRTIEDSVRKHSGWLLSDSLLGIFSWTCHVYFSGFWFVLFVSLDGTVNL